MFLQKVFLSKPTCHLEAVGLWVKSDTEDTVASAEHRSPGEDGQRCSFLLFWSFSVSHPLLVLNPLLHSSFPSPSSRHIAKCPSSWERHVCSVLSVNSLVPHLPNCLEPSSRVLGQARRSAEACGRMQPPVPSQEQAFSSQLYKDYRPYLILLSNFSFMVLIIMISSSFLFSNITLDSENMKLRTYYWQYGNYWQLLEIMKDSHPCKQLYVMYSS